MLLTYFEGYFCIVSWAGVYYKTAIKGPQLRFSPDNFKIYLCCTSQIDLCSHLINFMNHVERRILYFPGFTPISVLLFYLWWGELVLYCFDGCMEPLNGHGD